MTAVVESGHADGPHPGGPAPGQLGLPGVLVGLVNSEFRKIFSTNVWWALLIPVAVLTFGAGWLGASAGGLSALQVQVGEPLPMGLLTVSVSTNLSAVLAALFGTMAITSEHRHKTITTTYLTGTPRGAVVGSKLVAYAVVGLVYGLVNMICASLGSLLGSGVAGLGNPGDWFALVGAGLLTIVLWTLLGVGLGGLVTSSVGSIIVLLVYKFVFEKTVMTLLAGSDFSGASLYLPGAAGDGIVGNLAVPAFVTALTGTDTGGIAQVASELAHTIAGGSYGSPWWLSLLTFAGYTAVIVLAGWLVSRQRDIS